MLDWFISGPTIIFFLREEKYIFRTLWYSTEVVFLGHPAFLVSWAVVGFSRLLSSTLVKLKVGAAGPDKLVGMSKYRI